MRAGEQTRIWLNEVLTLHLRMERLDLVMKSKDWLAHNDFHKAKQLAMIFLDTQNVPGKSVQSEFKLREF